MNFVRQSKMAKFNLIQTKEFIKSFKNLKPKDKEKVRILLKLLENGEVLPPKYCDHQLKGDLKEFRECHIRGDLLLLYRKKQEILTITAINVGSHNQIFDDT